MKKVFCLVQFCLSVIFSFTQKLSVSDKDAPNYKYSCFINNLETPTNANLIKAPFGAVKIIDSRADTTKIGFFYNSSALKMTKLCFKQNATVELSKFFNSFFRSNFSESNN